MDTYDDLKTVIFRFRDLVTPEGGTIARHESIAKKEGYVWWGWWKKGGESLPIDALIAWDKLKDKHVYLFDSGRLKLYRVECLEMTWDPKLGEIPSPDVGKTPDYYNERDYLLWLKLGPDFEEIEDESEVLESLSYRRVDECFANRESNYGVFYDKRIFDLEELRQQDRTMWFVREFQNGDAVNEVKLTSANRINPEHFATSYADSKSLGLLWLSDVHCGPHHAYPATADANRMTLPNQIRRAVEESLDVEDYGGIIVSGDLTWSAQPDEFAQMETVLYELCRVPVALHPYRTIVCPGNHDVAFSDEPATYEAPVQFASDEARKGFAEFYRNRFYIEPNDFMCSGRRLLLGRCVPVEIVALNTSMLEQKSMWFQGNGYVGQAQLDEVEERFGWKGGTDQGSPRPYRILVMHHHLVPTGYNLKAHEGYAYSTVLDAGRIMNFVVRHKVDLVLHGHMHETFLSLESRALPNGDTHSFYVAGMGSTGLKVGAHAPNKNVFGYLSFDSAQAPRLKYVTFDASSDESEVVSDHELVRPPWVPDLGDKTPS